MTGHGPEPKRRIERLGDRDILRGVARFGDDSRFPNELHAVFVRSPHAHARVLGIDTTLAVKLSCVAAVFTIEDLTDLGPMPFQSPVPGPDGGAAKAPPLWPLARDVVRHVGEPVAIVIAESRHAARDGAEAVTIEYHPLPAVLSARAAASIDAPLLDESLRSNVAAIYRLGDRDAVEVAFAMAPHHMALTVRNNRVAAVPMEPNVSVAEWTETDGAFSLYTGVQAPHTARDMLAQVLNIPPDRLRIIVPRLGGGFGGRIVGCREDAVLLSVARRLRRPIRWRAERSEMFLAAPHARDHDADIEGAFDAEGHLLALRTHVFANLGASPTYFGIPIATATSNRIVDGPYCVPATHVTVECVLTTTVPTGPYRGAGRPEVIHRIERLMDVAADVIGLDAAEIRRRNLVPAEAMPYRNNAGQLYDSGNYPALLDQALKEADWTGFPARRAASEARGRLRGRGICCHIDTTSGIQPHETVQAQLTSEGRFRFFSGTQEMGQSIIDSYRALAADVLGVSGCRIEIVQGDTGRIESGVGSYGSRSLHIGGSALREAAIALRAEIVQLATRRFNHAAEDIVLDESGVRVQGTDRTLSWTGLAAQPEAIALRVSRTFSAPFNFPNGCYVCEVEIDTETGAVRVERFTAVDDVGSVFNPVVVHAQVQGGVAQGIGQALLEECTYDEIGQLLAGSLMDYALPRATDVPSVHGLFDQRFPSPTNPLGVKGAGESGAVGAPPAVVAAVLDALRPYGVQHLDMPIRSGDVWRRLKTLQKNR